MVESTPSTSTSSSRSSVPPRDNHQHDDRIITKDERCCTCCTAQSCSSCTASCVADCVAVCCCPCAIVNLFVLAFVKVPCLVGKRCVRVLVGKSRGRMRILMSKNKKNNKKDDEKMMMMIMGGVIGEEYQSTLERCGGNHNNYLEGYCGRDVNIIGDGSEEELVVEGDERVWWELYQVGHWGFGRLSFSGNNNNNNNNNNNPG